LMATKMTAETEVCLRLRTSRSGLSSLASPWGGGKCPPTLPQLGPEIRVNATSLTKAVGGGGRVDRLAKSSGIDV